MSSIQDLQNRAVEIQNKYKLLNKSSNFDAWGPKEYAMGLVGDTGDLLKIIMAKENLRTVEGADDKLKHELSDCLWSLLVLSAHYEVDLNDSFLRTMDELDARLSEPKQ